MWADIPTNLRISLISLFAVMIIVALVSTLLNIYASVAMGTVIMRSRIMGTVASYFILNTIEGLLIIPFMFIPVIAKFGRSMDSFNNFILKLSSTDIMVTLHNGIKMMWVFTGLIVAINLIFMVAHYFITRYIFKNKLNLE